MTKPTKLYALLLSSSSRSIAYRDFEKLVLAFGFTFARMNGSHAIYEHPNCLVPSRFSLNEKTQNAIRFANCLNWWSNMG